MVETLLEQMIILHLLKNYFFYIKFIFYEGIQINRNIFVYHF